MTCNVLMGMLNPIHSLTLQGPGLIQNNFWKNKLIEQKLKEEKLYETARPRRCCCCCCYCCDHYHRHHHYLLIMLSLSCWKLLQLIKNVIDDNLGCSKTIFVKELSCSSNALTVPTSIANKFNEYFTHISPNLADKIPYISGSHLDYIKK